MAGTARSKLKDLISTLVEQLIPMAAVDAVLHRICLALYSVTSFAYDRLMQGRMGSLPLPLTIVSGRPRSVMNRSSSRATSLSAKICQLGARLLLLQNPDNLIFIEPWALYSVRPLRDGLDQNPEEF